MKKKKRKFCLIFGRFCGNFVKKQKQKQKTKQKTKKHDFEPGTEVFN